jgi:hypothetical protein
MKESKAENRQQSLFKGIALTIVVLTLGIPSLAQEGLTIRNSANPKLPVAEANKIYVSACAAVQREFRSSRELRPQVTLLLGTNKKEGLDISRREIRLAKWNPFMFAQGVVLLAFEELMPQKEVLDVSKRALTWADSTVDVSQIKK